MCIKDYETKTGGRGPVRAVELLGKKIYWETVLFMNITVLFDVKARILTERYKVLEEPLASLHLLRF
jgi:hypothetical protein